MIKALLRTLGVAMLLGAPVLAQTFGDISGVVRDTSGAAIPGATITLTNVATNAVRTATSNEVGNYAFPSLQPGVFNVKAEKQGFKTVTRANVEIQVQQSARLDFELPVGQITESIEVSASGALLATENSTVGTVIENKRIVDLPLNGRNYLQLVSLAPNVSYGFGDAGQAGSRQGGIRSTQNISVGGQRSYYNRFTLDGVENTDPNFNTYVIQPSIDALQEFKVQTGIYPAEFGRGATQINVMTKPGTNDFHGTAFEFLRNDRLDAKNYAFTTNRPPKDPFKWNQYGGTLGGPVWIPKIFNGRNKLFFMANYEGFRQRRQVRGYYDVPSTAMFGGNFGELPKSTTGIYDPKTRKLGPDGKTPTAELFPGNVIPQSRFHPTAVKFLEFYAQPNVPNPELRSNYQKALGRPINRDMFVLRMDFVESSSSQWFGRYSWGDENQLDEGLKLNGSSVLTNVEQYMGSNTRVLSPSVVNEARFGYTRFFNASARELAYTRNVVSELNIPGVKPGPPATWGIPSVALANYSGFGDADEGPYVNNNHAMQFVDNVSWIKGKHSFRLGGEFRQDVYNQQGNQFARGSFIIEPNATQNPAVTARTGDSFADFLLGYIRRPEVAISIAEADFHSTGFALYVDDSWKVTPKLTLSLGLRYENTPPWEDQTGRLINVKLIINDFTPQITDQSKHPVFLRQGKGEFYDGLAIRWPDITTVRDGSLGNRLVGRDNNDFAPRIGISYAPSSKWVFRVGAGWFYSQDTGNPRFDMARNLAGRVRDEARTDFPNLTFDNAFSSVAGVAQVFRPYAFNNLYARRTPYSIQYLLNVQRELPGRVAVEVGYLGSSSIHLEGLRNTNVAYPSVTGALVDKVPFREFGIIQTVDNNGHASYNSLGTKLTKRYSQGATVLVAYTFSKSLDNASAIRNHTGDTLFPQDSNCYRCERGPSSFHASHRFVTSALYDIPVGKGRKVDVNRLLDLFVGGWQVSGVLTLQSGFPFTVTTGSDRANVGDGFNRPDATGISASVPNPGPDAWFNPAAFKLQALGTYGNVGRNSMMGPGINSLDFSTLKDFPIKERHKVQFRFEAFNFPNHPVWGLPNSSAGAGASFATIRSTRTNMRQLQLALKYVF